MSMMTPAYMAAMAQSYSNQEGGVTIPAEKLNEVVDIPLGFQPLGISARPSLDGDGDDVLIAAYFEPAICRAKVTRNDNGLHFAVDWIRGVDFCPPDGGEKRSVRLFPDISSGGANRAQTMFYKPGSQNIWVSRNGGGSFYILTPPQTPGGRWNLTGRKVSLPHEGCSSVHSATLRNDGVLLTIEEDTLDETKWKVRRYEIRRESEMTEDEKPLPAYRYGIADNNNGDDDVWTVSDYRQKSLRHGIYYGNELVLPDFCGNGICFLSDGSALVTRYGQSYPDAFNGIPGALIYVPARLL